MQEIDKSNSIETVFVAVLVQVEKSKHSSRICPDHKH